MVRMKGDYDGAEPAPNSVAAENLVRLGRLTDNDHWLQLARQDVQAFASQINNYPQALVRMLDVQRELAAKPKQVVIAGRRGAPDTRAMEEVVWKSYDPGRLVLLADGADNQQMLAGFLPFIRTAARENGLATAYLCENFTCRLPVTSAPALARELGMAAADGEGKAEIVRQRGDND